MEISTWIVLYIVGILIEIGLIFIKHKIFSFFPIIISCIYFLIIKDPNTFTLSLIQCGICFIGNISMLFANRYDFSKRNKDLVKSKLKDLWNMEKTRKIINVFTICLTIGLIIASTTVFFANKQNTTNYYSVAKSSYNTIKNIGSLETEIESKTKFSFEKIKLLNSGMIETDGTGAVDSLNIDMVVNDNSDLYTIDFQSQISISSDYQAIVSKTDSSNEGGALIKDYLKCISLYNAFKTGKSYQFIFGNAITYSAKADGKSYIYQDDNLTQIDEDMQSVFQFVSVVENESLVEKIFFR